MTEDEEDQESQVNGQIRATENYVDSLKGYVNVIKEDAPKDRVEFAIAVARCLNGMGISVKGWASWLNNLTYLNQLTLEEFIEFYPKIRKVALEFIQIDIDVTQKKITDAKKIVVAQSKKPSNSKGKPYVS